MLKPHIGVTIILWALEHPPVPSSAPPALVEHLHDFTPPGRSPMSIEQHRSNHCDVSMLRGSCSLHQNMFDIMNLNSFCVMTSVTLEAFEHPNDFWKTTRLKPHINASVSYLELQGHLFRDPCCHLLSEREIDERVTRDSMFQALYPCCHLVSAHGNNQLVVRNGIVQALISLNLFCGAYFIIVSGNIQRCLNQQSLWQLDQSH